MARTKQTAKKSGIPRKNTGGKAPAKKSIKKISSALAGPSPSPGPALRGATKKVARKSCPTSQAAPVKAKRRNKPGVVALREIRKYQSTATMLVPRTPVVRLAKEIMQKLNPGTGKVQDEFPNRPKDMQIALKLRRDAPMRGGA